MHVSLDVCVRVWLSFLKKKKIHHCLVLVANGIRVLVVEVPHVGAERDNGGALHGRYTSRVGCQFEMDQR